LPPRVHDCGRTDSTTQKAGQEGGGQGTSEGVAGTAHQEVRADVFVVGQLLEMMNTAQMMR
jgi:hypothetical protein